MVKEPPRGSDLRTPWDTVIGTRSHVRVLRVLEQARESMAVRELARRSGEHLRAAQLAVERLLATGILERVGTGPQQQVRLHEQHPLTRALEQLFEAERARFDRVQDRLRSVAKRHASDSKAVWFRHGLEGDGAAIEIGLLAPSDRIDRLADAFHEVAAQLMSDENLSIDVRSWTEPDLETAEARVVSGGGELILLHGTLPRKLGGQRPAAAPRSHAAVDEQLRDRASRVTEVLKRRPELIRKARDEIKRRLIAATPQEAKTLREWQQILDGMSVSRLRRWLVGRTERATRLRQSMPFCFLEAAQQEATSGQRKS